MATVTITVPDTSVPAVVAAIKRRYPDLAGTDAAVGREGIARMVRETLRASESDRIAASVQQQLDTYRTTELAKVDAVLVQIA